MNGNERILVRKKNKNKKKTTNKQKAKKKQKTKQNKLDQNILTKMKKTIFFYFLSIEALTDLKDLKKY